MKSSQQQQQQQSQFGSSSFLTPLPSATSGAHATQRHQPPHQPDDRGDADSILRHVPADLAPTEVIGFAVIDACRTMACLAQAPPDVLFRAAQLIHVMLSRSHVREQLSLQDAAGDDLLCCAAAALLAVGKAVSLLSLSLVKRVGRYVELLMRKRRSASSSASSSGVVAGGGAAASSTSTPAADNLVVVQLHQRIARWERSLLEANGFRVISETPFPFAATAAHLVLELIAEHRKQRVQQQQQQQQLLPLPSHEQFFFDVVARCNDATRSAALAVRLPASVVAAAAVFLTLEEHNGLDVEAAEAMRGRGADGGDGGSSRARSRYPWAACLVANDGDAEARIDEAVAELRRVLSVSCSTQRIVASWHEIDATLQNVGDGGDGDAEAEVEGTLRDSITSTSTNTRRRQRSP